MILQAEKFIWVSGMGMVLTSEVILPHCLRCIKTDCINFFSQSWSIWKVEKFDGEMKMITLLCPQMKHEQYFEMS
jgi:hypothetical protein